MTITRTLLITSLFALIASTAFAGTIRVGPKRAYKTIQDGVNSASAGDKILIDKGVYGETVVITTPDLTVQPAKKGKKGRVTIDAGGAGNPLIVSGSGCVVKDLRVRNAAASGIGIVVGGANGIKLIRCIVTGGVDWGIATVVTASSLVSKCKVFNANIAGIYIGFGSLGTVVTNCEVRDPGTTGMVVASDSVTVTSNKVIGWCSYGISLGDPGNFNTCTGALVSENKIKDSGLASIEVNDFASHCVIKNNVMRTSPNIVSSWGVLLGTTSNHLLAGNVVGDCAGDSYYLMNSTWTKLYGNVSKDAGHDSYETHSTCSLIDFVENKSRRAGDSGFKIEGTDHTLMHNDSRKSNRLSGTGLDFETANAMSLLYSGNTYGTSDF